MNKLLTRWRTGLIITGIWLVYWILSMVQSYVVQAQTGRQLGIAPTALRLIAHIGPWMLFTPVLIAFTRRFPIDRTHWQRNLPLHFVVSLAVSYVDMGVWYMARRTFGSISNDNGFVVQWMSMIDLPVFTYFVVVAIVHAADYHARYQERRDRAHALELRTAQLETQLATAQLQVLKMQLQPHFLFNTLHAIAELVHEDPRAADRMVTGLGDLLRISLDNAGRQTVTLRQELEFLDAYLAIEQVRFRERLTVAMDIDPQALDASVPHLLLQPLVENAIRHGVAPRMGPGRVAIEAHRRNGQVQIEITDNGRGLPTGSPRTEGVGLRNTRARLEQMYGSDHVLELKNGCQGGVVARLVLPYQTGSEEEMLESQMIAVVER